MTSPNIRSLLQDGGGNAARPAAEETCANDDCGDQIGNATVRYRDSGKTYCSLQCCLDAEEVNG